MPNFMLLGPHLIPKLIDWDNFQILGWKLSDDPINLSLQSPLDHEISVIEELQTLKFGLNSEGFPHSPVMAYMWHVNALYLGTLSLAIQWRGAIPEGSPIVTSKSILSGICLPLPMPLIIMTWQYWIPTHTPYSSTPLHMPLMELPYKALQKHSCPLEFQTLPTLNEEALTVEQGIQQMFHLPYLSQAAGLIECLNT